MEENEINKRSVVIGEFYHIKGVMGIINVDCYCRVLSVDSDSAYCKIFNVDGYKHAYYMPFDTVTFTKTERRPFSFPLNVSDESR